MPVANDKRELAEKTTQSYAAIGVAFVCIVVGLPLWWKTTEVYRVSLPYSDIDALDFSQVHYRVDFTIVIFEEAWNDVSLSKFGETLKRTFENRVSESPQVRKQDISYKGNVRKPYRDEKIAIDKATTLNDLDQQLAALRILKEPGKYYFAVLPRTSTLLADDASLGIHRTTFLRARAEAELLVPLLSRILKDLYVDEAALDRVIDAAKPASHQKDSKERMRSVNYHPGYEVTFTLLNPQPDIVNVHWDITAAVTKFLQPLVKSFEDYTEVSVKSQCLHYTGLSVQARRSQQHNYTYLTLDDLPHIINPVEPYLGYHVSTNPNLNFIVYIPTSDQSPLMILDQSGSPSSSNSFLSPRWGGMMVYNVPRPSGGQPLPLSIDLDMSKVMATFLSQLRLLLGIVPQTSPKGVHIEQPGNMGIAEWEMDKWLRAQALQNVASTTLTLKSLIQLLGEVGNIVINDVVGNEVNRAIESIQSSQQLLRQGNLKQAFLASRQAIISSEKAFFDPSLLQLLYFPEDQKFAIYIPLFLPISIPVLLSLVQAIKFLRNKNKKTEKLE